MNRSTIETLEPRRLLAAASSATSAIASDAPLATAAAQLAPASLRGTIIDVKLDSNNTVLRLQFFFVTDVLQFAIIDENGTEQSRGTYTYTVNSETAATIVFHDPNAGPDVTANLTFTTTQGGTISVHSAAQQTPTTGTFSFGFTAYDQGVPYDYGTAGDDVISVVLKNHVLYVTQNGVTHTYLSKAVQHFAILAFEGNDSVTIGPGILGVYVDAGIGNDLVVGGDNKDTITGGAGKDILIGGAGDDRLNGNGSPDALSGGLGNDRLYGNDGDDVLSGQSNVDRLFGGLGNDYEVGGSGSDKLYGEENNDILDGGIGDDLLDGASGDDRMAGGDGADTMFGGSGVDVLDGGISADSIVAGIGNDKILVRDLTADVVDGGGGTDSAQSDGSDNLTSVEVPIA